MRGVAGVYLLSNSRVNFKGQAKPRGLFRKHEQSPLPGDIVEYKSSEDPDIPWVITDILDRKNQLKRPPMANLDMVFLTASAEFPRVDYNYLDRMLAYAMNNNIEPVLILTKCDLENTQGQIDYFTDYFSPTGFKIYYISLVDDTYLGALADYIEDKLVAFAGQSGVGKSTLMNRLMGKDHLETGAVSKQGGRGKQTTRSTEIYEMAGGYLADTPGFQTLDIQNMDLEPRDLAQAYPEIVAIADHCRFADCRHMGEPGCAIGDSNIHPDRLNTYRKLRQDLEDHEKYGKY